MRLLIGLVVAAVGLFVGFRFGWNFVLAPALGYLFVRWAIGSLRAMTGDAKAQQHLDQPQAVVVAPAERVLYWCDVCGTEVLLVTRGTDKPPRHCATSMQVREEIPRA